MVSTDFDPKSSGRFFAAKRPVGGSGFAIAYTRLADGDRTDAGHLLALRQMTVAHDALVALMGLQVGMLAEKVRDLGLAGAAAANDALTALHILSEANSVIAASDDEGAKPGVLGALNEAIALTKEL